MRHTSLVQRVHILTFSLVLSVGREAVARFESLKNNLVIDQHASFFSVRKFVALYACVYAYIGPYLEFGFCIFHDDH